MASSATTMVAPVLAILGDLIGHAVVGFIAALLLWKVGGWLAHHLLVWLDRRHRKECDALRRSWPYYTVNHTKANARPSKTFGEWRLECHEGRQRWLHFPGNRGAPRKQSWFEKYQLGLAPSPDAVRPPTSSIEALAKGTQFLKLLQDPTTGHWPNDYSGPLFLLPGAVFAKYIIAGGNIAAMWPEAHLSEIRRYIVNTQNTDGGWGLHTESHSTMFGTCLCLAALRMSGEERHSAPAAAASAWIKKHGGAVSIPSWGKAWLSILGLYSWEGCNPVPPEMWYIPEWCTLSMGRVWCHSRVVTMPVGYFYGKRYVMPATPLIQELQEDMYCQPYASIPWRNHRSNVFQADIYTPHSLFYKFANEILKIYEKCPIGSIRKKSIDFCLKHMEYDDELTDYICLGPVNKTMHMVVCFLEHGADSLALQRHIERLDDYMWMGPEGMRMAGYNGSQLWDTSFAAQAMIATGDLQAHAAALRGAYQYVDVAQVRRDPPSRQEFFHSPTKGCWNFSTRDQAWQVSDCTAEGLRVALLLRDRTDITGTDQRIADDRLCDAVDVILALRDTTGFMDKGWASYEEPRSYTYMELLNCAELYKDIMIDYTYTECSSSCVHSLVLFQRAFPGYRTQAVAEAVAAGVKCIKGKQRADGSWYGAWGNCFTYAAWLATEALLLAGESRDSETMTKACVFLLEKQRADGGWGEDFNSCVRCEWVEHPDGSQVVNTAWSVMALLAAGGARHRDAVERGVAFLLKTQKANGDWEQQRITGVFNGNCAIHYPGYKNCMPVWALAKYHAMLATLVAPRASA